MTNKAEIVGPGKFVAYTYKLTDADSGEILFEATSDAPDTMVFGVSEGVVPGLTVALKGLAAEEKFEVTLPQDAAFGPRSEEWVKKLPKSIFEREDGTMPAEVKEGAILPMMTDQGFTIQGRVTKINDTDVIMDFNHPFAGKTVRYEGEVTEVRDATADELNPKSCGCGCGHDHCSDSGCSNGCCSDGCCH